MQMQGQSLCDTHDNRLNAAASKFSRGKSSIAIEARETFQRVELLFN